MDNLAGVRLRELLSRYGADLAQNPARLRALLNDTMPENRREVFALVAAAEEGVPAELLASGTHQSTTTVGPQLSRRLARDRAMDTTAADWAVATWAQALSLEAGPLGTPVPDPGSDTVPDSGSSRPPEDKTQPPVSTRSRTPWLIGGGAVAVLAAVLLITNPFDGEPGSSETPASIEPFSAPPPSFASEPAPSFASEPAPSLAPAGGLLSRVPPDLRDDCEVEEEPGFLVESVSCRPAGGTWVTYWRYATLQEMYAEYDHVVADEAEVEPGAGSCPDTLPAENEWNYEGSSDDEVVGRLVCYLNDKGAAWIETTHDDLLIYYWAFRVDGNMELLYDAWVDDLGPIPDE